MNELERSEPTKADADEGVGVYWGASASVALYVVSSLLGLSAVVLTTSGELKAMLLLLTLAAVAYVASRVIFPREIAETAHEKELEQEEMQAKSAAPVPEEKEEKHEEN